MNISEKPTNTDGLPVKPWIGAENPCEPETPPAVQDGGTKLEIVRLYPCPFCGDNDVEMAESATPKIEGGKKAAVFCNSCYCEGPPCDNEALAREAWNDQFLRKEADDCDRLREAVNKSDAAVIRACNDADMAEQERNRAIAKLEAARVEIRQLRAEKEELEKKLKDLCDVKWLAKRDRMRNGDRPWTAAGAIENCAAELRAALAKHQQA